VECRIEITHEFGVRLVCLAGCLGSAQVPALLEGCASARGSVRLDLSDLVSADAVGLKALWRLREKGADLIGAPEYIHLKLETMTREAAIDRPLDRKPHS
jgi:hypothetical protein